MMNKFKRISCVLTALMISCSVTVSAATKPTPTPEPTPEATEAPADIALSNAYISYDAIAEFLAEHYIDESLTKEDMMTKGFSEYLAQSGELGNVLKAMISSLDPYSNLYTADEYKDFESSMNNSFYGLGITLEQNGQYVEIVEINSDQASESGFKVGDRIVEVDGVDVVGWSVSDVRSKVIGELGTTVKVKVLRNGANIDIVGVRTEVKASTVNYSFLEGDIGYIKITSFGNDTSTDFMNALDQLNKKNIKKIILDLRNNGGGIVYQAVTVAQSIVPKGKIVDVKFRDEQYNVSYTSELTGSDKQFIVLVNENTASSAEILASAMQDSGAGKLLGMQTYGKAVVQNGYPLDNGSVINLTVGQYITRNGNEINGVGLTPDIEVRNVKNQIDATQYTKFDFRTKWALGSSGTGIRAAKERLRLLGYYIGSADNECFTADLQSAIKEFQLDNNLTPYGILDVPTQAILEREFEELNIYEDTQLEEAYKLFGGKVNDLYK